MNVLTQCSLVGHNHWRPLQFYLSLENSLCQDYITEKFWKVLPHNMIPVILNGVDMTKVAPPHSYIDIKDFKNFNGRCNIQKNTHDII